MTESDIGRLNVGARYLALWPSGFQYGRSYVYKKRVDGAERRFPLATTERFTSGSATLF